MENERKLKRFFALNEEYGANIEKYTKIDGLMAILLFFIFCGFISLLAQLWRDLLIVQNHMRLFLNIFSLAIIVVTFGFVRIKKQKLASVGIGEGKKKKSIFAGAILAIIFFIGNFGIEFVRNGGPLASFDEILSLVLYFLLVSFSEEIVFRGYIQTRLHGIVKNKIVAVMLGALMFTIMHFPFRMIQSGWGLQELFNYIIHHVGWVINLFVMHMVWDFIYKKTNSVYGSILSHWVSNLAGSLLV